jgi:hypothetical protein
VNCEICFLGEFYDLSTERIFMMLHLDATYLFYNIVFEVVGMVIRQLLQRGFLMHNPIFGTDELSFVTPHPPLRFTDLSSVLALLWDEERVDRFNNMTFAMSPDLGFSPRRWMSWWFLPSPAPYRGFRPGRLAEW